MWLEQFIGICQESVGLSEMRGGYNDHVPESVLENDDYKLLRDFSVRTDHEIGARRPDLMIIDKRERSCQIIDVAIPEDGRVREKEDEKIKKYQDLAREVRGMLGVRSKVIPVVVGIDVGISVELIQKCALLGSARILRKVLET